MNNWVDVRNYLDNEEPLRLIPEGKELIPVVGLTFVSEYPGNILALSENACVDLVRNPDNKYDSNAIEVRMNTKMLGHIPKETAARIAPELDRGIKYEATIFHVRISPENPNNPGLDILLGEIDGS